MIVIDTDVLIEIFDRKSLKGDEALDRIVKSGEKVCITVINLHEILYGLQKYAKEVREVLQLPVLRRREDAILAARLELEAERRGMAIRRTDAMIAAITINNDASLYTFDVKHFGPMQALGLSLFH